MHEASWEKQLLQAADSASKQASGQRKQASGVSTLAFQIFTSLRCSNQLFFMILGKNLVLTVQGENISSLRECEGTSNLQQGQQSQAPSMR
jgi:hypothetical protein